MICKACHIAVLHPNNKHSSHTLETLIIHVITCIPHLITSTSFRITGNENENWYLHLNNWLMFVLLNHERGSRQSKSLKLAINKQVHYLKSKVFSKYIFPSSACLATIFNSSYKEKQNKIK